MFVSFEREVIDSVPFVNISKHEMRFEDFKVASVSAVVLSSFSPVILF